MQHPQILIVDDDEHVRTILEAFATRAIPESRSITYASGEEALEHFKLHGADLLVTDYIMPQMDGAELVKQIRSINLQLPVIMVSGSSEARAAGEAAGIDCFVEKRFLSSELEIAIQKLMKAGAGTIPAVIKDVRHAA